MLIVCGAAVADEVRLPSLILPYHGTVQTAAPASKQIKWLRDILVTIREECGVGSAAWQRNVVPATRCRLQENRYKRTDRFAQTEQQLMTSARRGVMPGGIRITSILEHTPGSAVVGHTAFPSDKDARVGNLFCHGWHGFWHSERFAQNASSDRRNRGWPSFQSSVSGFSRVFRGNVTGWPSR